MTPKSCAELQARIEVLETTLAMIAAAAQRGMNPMLAVDSESIHNPRCGKCHGFKTDVLSYDGKWHARCLNSFCNFATFNHKTAADAVAAFIEEPQYKANT